MDGWNSDMGAAPKRKPIDVWLGNATADEIEFYCQDGTRRSAAWHWKNGKFRPIGGFGGPVFVEPTHWRHIPPPPPEE